jgi:hypothetical protein
MAEARITKLGNRSALCADDQQVVGFSTRVQTRGPGVDGIEPVDQPLFVQEVQSAVNGGGRRAGLDAADLFEQIVRFDATFLSQEYFQYLASYGRQALAALLAELFSGVELFGDEG